MHRVTDYLSRQVITYIIEYYLLYGIFPIMFVRYHNDTVFNEKLKAYSKRTLNDRPVQVVSVHVSTRKSTCVRCAKPMHEYILCNKNKNYLNFKQFERIESTIKYDFIVHSPFVNFKTRRATILYVV